MALAKDTQRGTWYFYGYYRDITGKKHRYLRRGFKTKKEAKEAERVYRLTYSNTKQSITLDSHLLISYKILVILDRIESRVNYC